MVKRNVNLDIIRIIAMFMVVSVHVGQYVGFDFGVGAKGVQLFFVVSGYLAFSKLSKDGSVTHYYKNRFDRIFPTYEFCLLLIFLYTISRTLVYGESIKDLFTNGQCSLQFLRYIFGVQCFIPSSDWNMWNNYMALWTISSFIGFYLVAPFLYKIMKRFYSALIILVLTMTLTPIAIVYLEKLFAFYPENAHIEWYASMNPLTELYCFLIGSVMFVTISENKQAFFSITIIMTLIVTQFRIYPYEFASALMVLTAVSFEPVVHNNGICKILSSMSECSFTLYLLQAAILEGVNIIWNRFCGEGHVVLFSIVLYSSCIMISYVVYHFVIKNLNFNNSRSSGTQEKEQD